MTGKVADAWESYVVKHLLAGEVPVSEVFASKGLRLDARAYLGPSDKELAQAKRRAEKLENDARLAWARFHRLQGEAQHARRVAAGAPCPTCLGLCCAISGRGGVTMYAHGVGVQHVCSDCDDGKEK